MPQPDELERCRQVLARQEARLRDLSDALALADQRIAALEGSLYWRLGGPLRRQLDRHPSLRFALRRGLSVLKGLLSGRRISGSGQSGLALPPEVARPLDQDHCLAVPFADHLTAADAAGSTAVLLHLFHDDLASEFRRYLSNIPFGFDLFISTDNDAKKSRIESVFDDWRRGAVEVRVVENRGFDIAPKLVAFRDIHYRYEFVLHLHAKKSLHAPQLALWRGFLLETLLGSPAIVASIMEIFRSRPDVGLVAPQHFEPMRHWLYWRGNFAFARRLAEDMGFPLSERTALDFPSGSMFWARSAALKPLLDLDLSLEEFSAGGGIDRNLAHAVERLYFHCCEFAGYTWIKIAHPPFYEQTPGLETIAGVEDLHRFVDRYAVRLLGPNPPAPRRQAPQVVEQPTPGLRARLDAVGGDPLPPSQAEPAPMVAPMVAPLVAPLVDGAVVIDGAAVLVRRPRLFAEMALFSATVRDGGLAGQVPHRLASLRRQGIAVMLILSDGRGFVPATELLDSVDGLMIREEGGGDLSAWAHALAVYPGLYGAQALYLVSDGPMESGGGADFAAVIPRLRECEADVVGLAQAQAAEWPLLAGVMMFRQRALGDRAMQQFFRSLADFAPPPVSSPVSPSAALRFSRMIQDMRYQTVAMSGGLADGLPAVPPVFPIAVGEVERQWLRVALIGPWNFNNGLGVAARGYAAALRRTGVLLNLHPIEPAYYIHHRIAPSVAVREFSGPADVALVQLNPDGWKDYLTPGQRRIIAQAKRSIGLWVWEQEHIPPSWLPDFHAVDAIWAPSRFCAGCYAAEAKVPVHVIPYVVPVDRSVPDGRLGAILRRGLGLAAEDRLILYVFDGASYLIRKNPAALVRAFSQSGLGGTGWRLVLKTKNLLDQADEGRRLQSLVEQTPGVRLVDRALDLEMMAELMHAAEIYASPHCSEGFGLTIAEAMAMGKTVVATDYGGSGDFLSADCGFPVRYQLAPIVGDGPVYGKGGRWAQVDEAHLAQSLRLAAEAVTANSMSGGGGDLAEAARRRVGDRLSPDAVAGAMVQSLRSLLGMD